MEGTAMKRFWKRQLPAFLLVLIMMISLVPAAMADPTEGTPTGEETPCAHKDTTTSTTEADCTTAGKTTVTCSYCGQIVSETAIPALGHDLSDWETTSEPTCTTDGVRGRSCKRDGCNYMETDRIPAEHKWGEWKTTKTPTCAAEGEQTRTCSACGDTETKPIPRTTDHVDKDGDGLCDVCNTPVNHVHVYKPAKDANKHWEECACGSKINEGAHYDDNGDGKCDKKDCGATVHVHKFPTTWTTNSTQHWHQCSCGEKSSVGSHADSNKDGKCDTCGYQMSTYYTIKFSYLSSSMSMKTTSETVPVNGSILGYAPIVSDVTYDGTTYQFKGWASVTSGSKWYIYNGQSLLSSSTKATGAMTYYAVYTEEDDSTITYTVDAGKEEDFNSRDFKKVHEAACSDTFEYVTFSVSSSTYNKFTGTVYSGKTELSASDLKSDFYYDEDDAGKNDYALDDLSLAAPKGAKDSSISIDFTTHGTKNKTTTGTLKLEVGGGDSDGTITYKVAPGGTVDFEASDFNTAYKEMSGSTSSIRWVAFSATSAYTSFDGTLYCGSTAFSRSDLSYTKTKFYYSSTTYGDYDLDKVSFTADKDADDGDSLELSFRAYRSDSDYETGTVKIVIDGDAVSGDITYEVAPGGKVDFDRSAFNKFFQKEYKNYTVSYVEFDKPSASAFSEGTLYHDYGGSSQTSFTRTSLGGTKFYYSPGSKDYDLDELTFKADSDFEDDVTLTFTAYGTGSRSVEGTVVIRSTKKASGGDITLTVTPGKSVDLDKSKFQSFLRSECGDKKAVLDYVTFDRPTSSSVFSDGALYSGYGKSGAVKFTQSNLSGYSFYYDSKDATGSKEYGLDTLSFVADSTFKDSIELTFTVYGDDDEEEEGTLVIKSDGTSAAASNYVGSVRYATTTGTRVQINANDIARFFSKNAYGAAMQYVTITGVPSSGSLYYNYYNTSKYGTTTRAQLTAANCSGQSFYASPTATNQFALTELTYVPSGTNYCASIPFTAYGGSRSVSGAILISVSGSAVAEVYGVTPKNTAVTFPASNISKAVSSATGATPVSIQLLSLPAYTAGAVYVGSGTTTLANTTSAYAIFSSGGQSLRFVPATGYTGSVEIPYVALNSSGAAIASGCFSLGVVNSKKTFTDVSESTWCYKYVAELSSASVIDGYSNGSFKPNNTVTYGAALKLIMLAAGYPEQAPTGKNVFSGYLDKARSEGIITRSNIDLTKPITRLQVAQLAAGAMKLNTSNLSTVQPFTDTTDTSVRALNAAGIVEGYFSNGTSTFKPNNTLTRGQVSAIVWRMRNYNK